MLAKKFFLVFGFAIASVLLLGGALSLSFAQTNSALDMASAVRNKIQASGFITPKPMPFWGTIMGTKEIVWNLSQGEVCFIQMIPGAEVKIGDRLAIGRFGSLVTHPFDKRVIGRHVTFSGELVILETKGTTATAKIEKSFQSVYVGDMVLPLQQTIPVSIPLRSSGKVEGWVVFAAERDVNITANEVIFIDRGTQDGVIPGDRFNIYRTGYFSKEVLAAQKEEPPLVKVGEAVAVTVQDENTTALVTKSSASINIGFKAVSAGK